MVKMADSVIIRFRRRLPPVSRSDIPGRDRQGGSGSHAVHAARLVADDRARGRARSPAGASSRRCALSWVAISTVVPGPVDPVEQPHDPVGGGGIEVAGWLVCQQDQGAVDEGSGDGNPLLLAAGELVREVGQLLAEPDQVEDLRAPVTSRRGGAARSPRGRRPRSRRPSWSAGAGSPGRRSRCCGAGRAPSTAERVPTSLPATQTSTPSACSSLVTRRRKVDLPEPDGPTRKTNSPFWMSTDIAQGDRGALVGLGDVLELDHREERRLRTRVPPRKCTCAVYGSHASPARWVTRACRSPARRHRR